ncbi:hypothetical protein BC941DRAFT_511337 [Chlamydoabsidia padenii]|nr:hypothetical protein BC941DRAFT_511337 [Chlamydoabsidia padenii]
MTGYLGQQSFVSSDISTTLMTSSCWWWMIMLLYNENDDLWCPSYTSKLYATVIGFLWVLSKMMNLTFVDLNRVHALGYNQTDGIRCGSIQQSFTDTVLLWRHSKYGQVESDLCSCQCRWMGYYNQKSRILVTSKYYNKIYHRACLDNNMTLMDQVVGKLKLEQPSSLTRQDKCYSDLGTNGRHVRSQHCNQPKFIYLHLLNCVTKDILLSSSLQAKDLGANADIIPYNTNLIRSKSIKE